MVSSGIFAITTARRYSGIINLLHIVDRNPERININFLPWLNWSDWNFKKNKFKAVSECCIPEPCLSAFGALDVNEVKTQSRAPDQHRPDSG